VQVTSGQTLELYQEAGAAGNIFSMDGGKVAYYADTVVKSSGVGQWTITKMDPKSKRLYVRAWGYDSNPDTNGTGLCSPMFGLTQTASTTTIVYSESNILINNLIT
jgi:hypothetical protein